MMNTNYRHLLVAQNECVQVQPFGQNTARALTGSITESQGVEADQEQDGAGCRGILREPSDKGLNRIVLSL